jgi:hypothetical protein
MKDECISLAGSTVCKDWSERGYVNLTSLAEAYPWYPPGFQNLSTISELDDVILNWLSDDGEQKLVFGSLCQHQVGIYAMNNFKKCTNDLITR